MVREKEESTERLTGAYVAGSGRAHLNIGSAKKRAEHTRLFGCPMVGTFNIELYDGNRVLSKPFLTHGADSYWLVRLRTGAFESYAYAVRWEGSKMRDDRMELLSKNRIPDAFKSGELEITVFERWSPEQVEAWQAGLDDKTKWQGHAFWQPLRADSAFVWKHIGPYDYRARTVLDIGCNAGYFSFRAAQRGAVVTGADKNKDILGVARTIQHHIEMTDVEFVRGAYTNLLDRRYDYIFYLSVHHQHDRRYEHLRATLEVLKERCGILFVELINPPLGGYLTKDAVDAMITENGGQELARYQHRVRSMRSLYVLQ